MAAAACCSALAFGAAPAGAAEPGVVANVLPAPSSALQDKVIAQVQALGARHVRAFLAWDAIEPAAGQIDQGRLDAYKSLGDRLRREANAALYLVVLNTPAWAGDGDPNSAPPAAKYAEFLRTIAGRLGSSVDAYEIWNEPDEKVFWKNSATPAQYTALLKAAYPAVKAGNPSAAVVVGGLVGGDTAFLKGLYDNGAKGYFDAVGMHTDHACGRDSPKIAFKEADGSIGRYSFTAYRELHKLMVARGDSKPIWMTELGWSVTHEKCSYDPSLPGGVSDAQQAQYLREAYGCLAAEPYMQRGTWFSLGDYGNADNAGNRFGLMDTSLTNPRPAFEAFKAAGGIAADPNCGPGASTTLDPGVSKGLVDGQKVSGVLKYHFDIPAGLAVSTITLKIDGKVIRTTGLKVLEGTFNSFSKLTSGPHTVTAEFLDITGTAHKLTLTINKVPYGQGEPIKTTLSLKLYGKGGARLAVSRLLTSPPVALSDLTSGKILVIYQKKVGSKYKDIGKPKAAGSRKIAKVASKKLGKGKYRVVVTFPGAGTFLPAKKVQAFTV
jgi:hypothetical protein